MAKVRNQVPVSLPTVQELALRELPRHSRDDGSLVVIEQGIAVPFATARVFNVRAKLGAVRGQHAHKRCAQFLVCAFGAVEVECDDGNQRRSFVLDRENLGLLIPPGIWASERYREEGSLLSVLCDRPYEEDDYIRDYPLFAQWRHRA